VEIIELNIAGLHFTGQAPSRAVVMRLWHRQLRSWSRNVKTAGRTATHLRARPAVDRSAA
jgi:hypothetical protein